MENVEISHFFPEIFKLQPKCKFGNCKHIDEPGCEVVRSVENNEIAPTRYSSYLSMLNGDEENDSFRQDIYKKE